MSGTPSTVADSEESVMETSTAPTTPDGSLSFSPLLQPMQLLDAFDGILASAGTPTPTIRNVPTNFDLNENAPAAVKNICCVGAGYVGKSVSLLPPSRPFVSEISCIVRCQLLVIVIVRVHLACQ